MKKIASITFLLLGVIVAWSQRPDTTLRSFIPSPPPGTVRTMAEWEEVQAIAITWTSAPETLTEIVRHAVQECRVLIVTDEPEAVSTHLLSEGIALSQIDFLERPFNSIWIRDYGPWTVYPNGAGEAQLIDWIYNRKERRSDDTIPRGIADFFEYQHYEAIESPFDWVHAGGNHLTDGWGTAFSSSLVLDENPDKTEESLDDIAQEYLGIERYYKLPKLPYDGIHHLDMHMRLLDEETLLVGQYPEGVADGPQIEANIQRILTHFKTPSNRPYRIVRIPMPPDQFGNYPDEPSQAPCSNALRANGCLRTYTNSLFINNTILVPVYDHPLDSVALAIYEQELPGYNVVGIDCNEIIPSVGALHCVSKLIGADDPLWIAHSRLRDTYITGGDYPVFATARHSSGIQEVSIFYKTEAMSFYEEVPMTNLSMEEGLWFGFIPEQTVGSTITYYIEAISNSEKIQQRPMVAPSGGFQFKILPIEAPADIDFFISEEFICAGSDVRFVPNVRPVNVSFDWYFPGGNPSTSTEAEPVVSYAEQGVYDVQLSVSNNLGSDNITKTGVVQVLGAGTAPFFEGFDDNQLEAIDIINPNQDETWEWSPAGQCTGSSIRMNNYSGISWGTSDYLRFRVNLTDLAQASLQFDVAYALSEQHNNRRDRLMVKLKECNGAEHILYNKYGEELATDENSNAFFIPNNCGDWRQESIDLTPFTGGVVEISIENMGESGNYLYLDNIDISSPQIPNLAPMVQIDAPMNGTTMQEPGTQLPILAQAYDEDGYVKEVVLYVNGDSVAVDDKLPFAFDFEWEDFGNYNFQLLAKDNDEAISWSETVEVELIPVNTRTIIAEGWTIDIYPNPARSQFQVFMEAPGMTQVQYELWDISGKKVMHGNWHLTEGQQTRMLSGGHLPKGLYQLRLYGEEQFISQQKIVFQ